MSYSKKNSGRTPSERAISDALVTHFGNVSRAARALHIDPRSLRRRIASNETLKTIRDEARDLYLDELEATNQDMALVPENVTERIFTLKTLGKSRGYIERQEITGADGNAIKIEVEYVNDPAATPDTP